MAFTTIDDPSAYFKVQLYTGNSGTNAITFDDTDTDMQPDMVYIKQRSNAGHESGIFDAVRGTSKDIAPNSAATEGSQSGVTAFGSDGFTLGSANDFNYNTYTYVAWCWKESATSGFDIVSYTGNDTARTISHSLSAVPHFIFATNRTGANREIYHHKNTAAPETDHLYLNTDAATADSNTRWNDTAPTSSVFSLGTSGNVNGGSQACIAWLWTSIQGFSKFGKYVGNGDADGTFVYTGFKPAMVIVKRTDSTGGWYMYDNKRAGYNGSSGYLQADTTSAEDTNAGNFGFDILSNGFKLKGTYATVNNSGGNYIFMAWAEAPFVNSNGVPSTAR